MSASSSGLRPGCAGSWRDPRWHNGSPALHDTATMTDLFDPPAPSIDGIHVGIGGWTYAPWRGGAFYPPGLVQRRELEYASRHVGAIEINGT